MFRVHTDHLCSLRPIRFQRDGLLNFRLDLKLERECAVMRRARLERGELIFGAHEPRLTPEIVPEHTLRLTSNRLRWICAVRLLAA